MGVPTQSLASRQKEIDDLQVETRNEADP